jgi:hypothetical protein
VNSFVDGGAEIAFFIGLMQYISAIICEGLNIYLLSF